MIGVNSLRIFKYLRPRASIIPGQLPASFLSFHSLASRRTLPGQRDVANQERPAGDVSSHQGLRGPGAPWRPLAGKARLRRPQAPAVPAPCATPPGDSGHFPGPHGQGLQGRPRSGKSKTPWIPARSRHCQVDKRPMRSAPPARWLTHPARRATAAVATRVSAVRRVAELGRRAPPGA